LVMDANRPAQSCCCVSIPSLYVIG
jgi:hypothetical protein